MSRRLELQTILEKILGSENVYFQPPENFKMKYDCIRFSRSKIEPDFADNIPYQLHDCYKVIAIYKDPDSELPHRLATLPMCSHDRYYTANNLNHDVFTLYY